MDLLIPVPDVVVKNGFAPGGVTGPEIERYERLTRSLLAECPDGTLMVSHSQIFEKVDDDRWWSLKTHNYASTGGVALTIARRGKVWWLF